MDSEQQKAEKCWTKGECDVLALATRIIRQRYFDVEYADARSRSHQLYLCRKSFPPSSPLDIFITRFFGGTTCLHRTRGTDALNPCIWAILVCCLRIDTDYPVGPAAKL